MYHSILTWETKDKNALGDSVPIAAYEIVY